MAKTLIKNGRIWDGFTFSPGDILTEGNIIAKMGGEISDPSAFVFDAKGKTVLPGLVDAHVHLKGISPHRWGTPAELSCFPFGVTSAADAAAVYGDEAHLDACMVKTAVFVPVRFQENHADFTETERLLHRYGNKALGVKVYFDAPLSGISSIDPLKEACAFAREKA